MHTRILKYFWIITLLFLAGAAYFSARLTGIFLAGMLEVDGTQVAAVEAQNQAPVQRDRLADYRPIDDRNIFNANPKPPEPETPEPVAVAEPGPVVPAMPTTPLAITLIGTAVVEGGRSFALIENRSELRLVREQDEVDVGAVLVAVLPDRIKVERGGTIQEFLLHPPEDASAPARSARTRAIARPAPSPPPDTSSDTIRMVGDNSWLIDKGEIEQASSNMNQLMTQIRVVPNFTDGQPDGFKVFAIRPGSLFAKIGLQNGDVVKRINGLDIQGPEEAFEAYQRLKDETNIQIDLSRRGENATFTYEIR